MGEEWFLAEKWLNMKRRLHLLLIVEVFVIFTLEWSYRIYIVSYLEEDSS